MPVAGDSAKEGVKKGLGAESATPKPVEMPKDSSDPTQKPVPKKIPTD